MTTTDKREVPDLEGDDGLFAQWDDEGEVARVHQYELDESITLTPTEIRELYAWVQEHKLT